MSNEMKQQKNKNSPPKSETVPNSLVERFPAIPPKEEVVKVEQQEKKIDEPVKVVVDQTLRITTPTAKKRSNSRSQVNMCEPKTTYFLTIGEGETSIQVPYQLPPEVLVATRVSVARENIGWIGREGNALRAHLCQSERGTVILTPQTDGSWKANAFSFGRITFQAVQPN